MNERFVIVGMGWAGRTIASVLTQKKPNSIVGFIADTPQQEESIKITHGDDGRRFPILGHSKNLTQIAKEHKVDYVINAVTYNRTNQLISQIVRCYEMGISVIEMPELYAELTHKIPVEHVRHQWIVPDLTRPKNGLYAFLHDALNYLISVIGLVSVVLPLWPFIAAVIKLDSPGAIHFCQKRIGKKGRIFSVIKFRTMHRNAENGKAEWAKVDDDRVTRVGRILRKFRLDEIPQFVNVLKGEMALIGPRPERPEFVEHLAKEIPFYNYRHLVKPGITGWAQVNYRYGNSVKDSLEKLQYDLYWIKHRSLWLDLKIILKSIKVVITGFGAF